mmetsp:Transcript_6726/g.10235  ORF Transcript_6726/g.10235 Transcript_6726/m.10235 type:complete len:212 (+) Transcript_6726:433-1068(+)
MKQNLVLLREDLVNQMQEKWNVDRKRVESLKKYIKINTGYRIFLCNLRYIHFVSPSGLSLSSASSPIDLFFPSPSVVSRADSLTPTDLPKSGLAVGVAPPPKAFPAKAPKGDAAGVDEGTVGVGNFIAEDPKENGAAVEDGGFISKKTDELALLVPAEAAAWVLVPKPPLEEELPKAFPLPEAGFPNVDLPNVFAPLPNATPLPKGVPLPN